MKAMSCTRGVFLVVSLGFLGCPSSTPAPDNSAGDEDIMFPDERAAANSRHPAS